MFTNPDQEVATTTHVHSNVSIEERMTGIEPALSAWEAEVLPLNYIRMCALQARPHRNRVSISSPRR